MKSYTVYKHTSPSGKVYIGITCRKPEYRWNHGKGYKEILWLDKGKLKFFGTKGWTLVAGEEGPDLSGYAKLTDIGTEESFIFTLEDDSKVTKSIRVISTTNS